MITMVHTDIQAGSSEEAFRAGIPRVCGTCQFWRPENDMRGTLEVSVWGHCHVGHDQHLTIAGRMTPDRVSCSAWKLKAA